MTENDPPKDPTPQQVWDARLPMVPLRVGWMKPADLVRRRCSWRRAAPRWLAARSTRSTPATARTTSEDMRTFSILALSVLALLPSVAGARVVTSYYSNQIIVTTDETREGPVDTPPQVGPSLARCWHPPAAGDQVTVQLSFRHDGTVFGRPRINFAQATGGLSMTPICGNRSWRRSRRVRRCRSREGSARASRTGLRRALRFPSLSAPSPSASQRPATTFIER